MALSTGLTIAIAAFLASLARGWHGQENKAPWNAWLFKWARRAFIVFAITLVITTIWLAGGIAGWWIWPLKID